MAVLRPRILFVPPGQFIPLLSMSPGLPIVTSETSTAYSDLRDAQRELIKKLRDNYSPGDTIYIPTGDVEAAIAAIEGNVPGLLVDG